MKKLLILVPLVVVCSTLTGCGLVAMVNSRSDMMRVKNQYTTCLEQHPSNISVCDGYKAAYKANMEAYSETSANLRPGESINMNTSHY